MARALKVVLKIPVVVLGVALTVTAALGWLYLLRPDLPAAGPSVANALPLDELSGRAGVALVPFVVVWVVAGLVLGALARAVGLGRPAAALVFAVAVGAVVFTATGMSILVTEQIPAGQAYGAARHVPAVYLAGALAGGCAALVARPWPRRRRREVAAKYVPLPVADD
jgi:uncharacterized membrane protein